MPVITTLALLILVVAAMLLAAPRSILNVLPAPLGIRLMAYWHCVDVDLAQWLTMADGTRLAGSLYRPKGATEPLPAVMIRVPYRRNEYSEGFNNALFFASKGYAVLVQDLRGTGESEGELLPWANTAQDAQTSINWITSQPWSNGRVGTFGCSALGETQLVSQDRAPQAWRAVIASGAGGAVGSLGGRHSYFGLFEGGVFQLASGFGWFVEWGTTHPGAPPAQSFDLPSLLRELPVSALVARVRPAPNGYSAFLSTPLSDSKWEEWGYLTDASRMRVPALIINTWGDQTLQDTLILAEHWRREDPEGTHGQQKVVIGAGNHCRHDEAAQTGQFGELNVANAAQPYRSLYLRWFDSWLRDQGDALAEFPAYTYYVVGGATWLTSETWPPPESHTELWYLGSEGSANSRAGTGRLTRKLEKSATTDMWRYDPADPVPSKGGPVCCTGNPADRPGPADQAEVETRNDVLVFTTAPMASDMWIAGPIKAHLVVSSDVKDTDLVARLVHVWPDGRATSIQEGALRLRYRDGFRVPKFLDPGVPVRVEVDMRSIAYRLPQGHRLRLDLTSSSFPRLERNLNTGGDNATETRTVIATNRVHYDIQGGSWLELAVLPRR